MDGTLHQTPLEELNSTNDLENVFSAGGLPILSLKISIKSQDSSSASKKLTQSWRLGIKQSKICFISNQLEIVTKMTKNKRKNNNTLYM